ncbi:polyketide synthase [Streptomyces inusitatus]|uniref:Polyketide synthase n=1 Tax=Streptomyces inusitatus TaxID=68221 RepID=A0A918QJ04_9ACTN|nr:type I polyketide synthase [Streptomyces inusitatus]GGZ48954.1 polyketide synthase [Streptomyces inusitatus]
MNRIAIVGMACRYPDAEDPHELWENALAGRRAFRRLPDERMRQSDYWDPDPTAPDRFYARDAAVIEGYEFDRLGHRVAGSTYRTTDLTHWLALDIAGRALADAGFPGGEGMPKDRTGVIVGNTLTGEFTRANTMRLRWPYVRRVTAAALREQGWEDDRIIPFLEGLEASYKSPFPPVDEDSLAGGLSNTIAGRICNHFDLNGGGYSVDGACSSSLLSVTQAAKSLLDGDIDIAITGGVDLSIDPFEIIGFAKTGALATGQMKVYDRGSNGFWPGEGCGMVVLMREQDALESGRRVYATIAGWGISSDGQGGITRPEISGYRLALTRAYERAGFGIETVPLFEGHGTGTAVGDATELQALTQARRAADPTAAPAAISSIKGMIGHTKAAAGIAGLIKAALAVDAGVLPPAIGCVDPHPILTGDGAALRALRGAEAWPGGQAVRAGVTAMGFGGINTHIVLDRPATGGPARPAGLTPRTRTLAASAQDTELLLVDADSPEALRERLTRIADFVPAVSYAELADLAATLQSELRDAPWRAAAVVSSPRDAEERLRELIQALDEGRTEHLPAKGNAFLGHAGRPGRIGYLFPGQGSGRGTSGGMLRRRFSSAAEVYDAAELPLRGDMVATEVAQPRIVTGSVAGLRTLDALGLTARVAVGHSLGEITALHWAGAMDTDTLLKVARTRGATMSEHAAPGSMASLATDPDTAADLIGDLPVVVAGYNGPRATVVAGPADALDALARVSRTRGVVHTSLNVSHAFHSPLVAPAAELLHQRIADEPFGPVGRRIISTVTGEELPADTGVPGLLRSQITEPVRFEAALRRAAEDVDLLIEVGPGRVLGGLAAEITDVPALSLDTDDESLRGLLRAAGAAYAVGAPLRHDRLFEDRLRRPLEVGAEFTFFASPCERAPEIDLGDTPRDTAPRQPAGQGAGAGENGLDLLRRLVAERAELPLETVGEDTTLLDDLHLSSITVGQIVNQAAQELGVPASQAPVNFATATVRELAEALQELAATGLPDDGAAAVISGAAAWARPFAVDHDELPLAGRAAEEEENGPWRLHAAADHPFAEELRTRLENAGVGPGTLVCLPPDCTEEHLALALAGAQEAASGTAGRRYVLVQHGRGAAGLAKTLRLETPRLRVTVVHTPPVAEAVDRVVAETAATTRFTEAHYDSEGLRRVPVLRPLPITPARTKAPLDASDVLLVTGGGKGITAECALVVARDHGARLAVLGRSDPAADEELAANLRRMADAGVEVRYARADVTDPEQVRAAVAELTAALGPVTAVLHGAGRNEPAAIASLDRDAFRRTLAPKADGLRAVLAAVDPARLKLLVTFGSIIGRAGLRGEGHYATANEWLADLTEEFARERPDCRTLCMEWSVWSGTGMGERLSVVESLVRDGITPISTDQGVELMRRLVADPDAPTTVVISGRTGTIDTVRHAVPPLPLLRFAEKPLLRYHGVELVTEVELNAGTDPYLADHLLDGNLLFPAVMGMEAMAQAAAAVTGWTRAPVIEDAEFLRPIVVPPNGTTTIRVAVVVTGDDTVQAVIQSADTGFAAEHFRARLVLADGDELPEGPPEPTEGLPEVPLDPAAELYGTVLFQSGRFRRLRRYHRAAARHVDAVIATEQSADWFAGFLPRELLLGDPGMRDALMHGNQVCVPDATLLPVAVDRIHPCGDKPADAGELRYCAVERSQDGDTYVYDIAVRTAEGAIVERWEGLRLRAVRKGDGAGPWSPVLLGPYLERAVGDLTSGRVAVVVEPDGDAATGSGGRSRTALAAGRALNRPVEPVRRPDGRPELEGGVPLSSSHGAGLTLCVVGSPAPDGSPASGGSPAAAVGCDVETVVARSEEEWAGLLGGHAPLARVLTRPGEDADTAATRVWAAVECLQKAGLTTHAPLTLTPVERDGWRVFASGELRVATLATAVRGVPEKVVFAILTGGGHRP